MSKFYTFIFLLLSSTAWAQKNLKESVPMEAPPVIDGKVEEWPTEWWIDPDGKFFCNVTNDADNIYVRLKVGDDLTQQKIGLFGLYLKLNPSGKRKGKVGIKYPIGMDASEFKKSEPAALDKGTELATMIQMKKQLVSDVEVIELIGLAKTNILSSRLGLANGIEVIIVAQEDGSYLYEAKIPFKAFRLKRAEIETLGVEFETGRYVPVVKSNNPSNPGASSNFGSRGMYGPGGMGQQQSRVYYNNSNYHYNALSTPAYLFVPVKLK